MYGRVGEYMTFYAFFSETFSMSKVGDTESRNKPTAAPASAGRQKLFKNEGKDQEVSVHFASLSFIEKYFEPFFMLCYCFV